MDVSLQELRLRNAQAWDRAFPKLWAVSLCSSRRSHPSLTESDHEDVAVRAITAVAQSLDKVTDAQHLIAFTARVAHHIAVSRGRELMAVSRGAGRVESLGVELPASKAFMTACDGPTVDEIAHQASLLAVLNAAMEALPDQPRCLLTDRYLHGLDYAELAVKHGLSEGSVGVYLRRALEALRTRLDRQPGLMSELSGLLR